MSGVIILALIVLVFVIIYQISRASEYATVLRGAEKVEKQTNKTMAWLLVALFILGMYGIYECHQYLMGMMLGESASVEGVGYDKMLVTTLTITGIVFFITQTLLFWFAFKFQEKENRRPLFLAHNNKLEVLWTSVPAIAMAVLVAFGLKHWLLITGEPPKESAVVEIVGKQFNWIVRYPGKDGAFGKRNFKNINDADNVLGQEWEDPKNHDDIVVQNGEMHLVVNKPVKLLIGSRDVIHDVGLPHFRLKMDAVPGLPTTLWFTPRFTSKEMKAKTGNPDFVYEISCDQMCGKGHYAMRGTIIVETQEEYDEYMAKQTPYYAGSPQGQKDPKMQQPQEAAPAEGATDTLKAISMK